MNLNVRFEGVNFKVKAYEEEDCIYDWEIIKVSEKEDDDLIEFFHNYLKNQKEGEFIREIWKAIKEDEDDEKFWFDSYNKDIF